MTDFTTRYGSSSGACAGARIWAHSRHNATIVTVAGRVDAENVDAIAGYAVRFAADTPLILDLGTVTTFTPEVDRLMTIVDDHCRAAGVEWAAVTARRPGEGAHLAFTSLSEAESHFDDAITRRRRTVLSLLSHPA